MTDGISTAFLQRAAEVLSKPLSGSQIIGVCSAFAVDFNVDIPHAASPFQASNKKTALFENLRAFSPAQQYQVIYELSDRASSATSASFDDKMAASSIKLTLLTRYSQLASGAGRNGEIATVVLEIKHWLAAFPAAKKLYEEALQKHASGLFTRNALDDLRLSLEALLRALLGNDKSLEKQVPETGRYIKQRGGSAELANMFEKLIDYYSKYQNTYVKHDDAVPLSEAEFVIEVTACFMKHLLRIKGVE